MYNRITNCEIQIKLFFDWFPLQPLFLYFPQQAVHSSNYINPLEAPWKYLKNFQFIQHENRRTFAGLYWDPQRLFTLSVHHYDCDVPHRWVQHIASLLNGQRDQSTPLEHFRMQSQTLTLNKVLYLMHLSHTKSSKDCICKLLGN